MKKYPLVVISWLDHCSNDEWHKLDDVIKHLNPTPAIVSAGYLIHEDDVSYRLMQNISTGDDGLMSMGMCILKACVTGYKEIPEGALTIGE